MSFKIVDSYASAAVPQNGTITFGYPDGTDSGTYAQARGHKLVARGLQAVFDYLTGFTLSFGASNITLTYLGATTIPAGTKVSLQLDEIGPDNGDIKTNLGTAQRTSVLTPVVVNLGAPDVADADGACASQAITAAGSGNINGALASGGVATFDQPRAVVAAWTGTAVMTVTGKDEYGRTVKESSGSGTSMTGKKAFKTITQVKVSADVTSATVGTGDVLGLPICLQQKGLIVREMEAGVTATTGTIVSADQSAATATTGDVRGTYDPNSACDGSKAFSLLAFVSDPADLGASQYAG